MPLSRSPTGQGHGKSVIFVAMYAHCHGCTLLKLQRMKITVQPLQSPTLEELNVFSIHTHHFTQVRSNVDTIQRRITVGLLRRTQILASLVNQPPPVRRPFCARCARSGREGVWHITYARTLPPTRAITAIYGQPLATKML